MVLLGYPAEDVLFQFLQDEFDFGQIHWLVTSHRDRLLLIDGPGPGTVRVNPLLLDDLLQGLLQPERLLAGALLPPEEIDSDGVLPWFSRAFAASLYAYLREEPEIYTRSGAVRKRAAGELRERFGGVLTGDAGQKRLEIALSAMTTLELIVREDDGPIRLVHDGWDELAELPDNWIQALLWATLVSTSLARVFEVAPLLIEFARRIPRNRWFTGAEILRILRLSGSGTGISFSRETAELLAGTGLLLPYREGFRLNTTAATVLDRPRGATTGAALHANMEITISPELTFRALLDLAAVSKLQRFDVMPVMEITERSIASARRIERLQAAATLHRITEADLPQNVQFLLDRWTKRAGAVRLVQGLVLCVEIEVAEILETAPEFIELPRDTLAPGVFLFHPEQRAVVEQLVARMGFAAPGGLENPATDNITAPEFKRYYLRSQQPVLTARPSIALEGIPPREEIGHREVPGVNALKDLQSTLREMDVPEEVERELALRIERKLILFAHQIRPDLVPRYGMEARGLDYLGKIRVAEQAIADQELLEVIMRTAAGAPQRILLRPREMSESGGDLMLRAVQLPEGTPVRIRIRRASLVRRLSGTLLRRRSTR